MKPYRSRFRTHCMLVFSVLLAPALLAAPATVEQWGLYEVALKGPGDGNPFLDVRLTATFTDGERTHEVAGFYDGDGVYRVRFSPEAPGEWRYETKSNRWELTDKSGVFTVTSATGANHGPVRVFNTYHFAYADGAAFKPVGTTIYNWTDAPDAVQEETLRTLAAAPFNKVRMLLTPQPTAYREEYAPPRWPFVGTPPRDWDFTRFNPAFFQHLEKRVAQLRDLGIEADVILFNPYGRWGFETMDAATDERYLRYVVARLGAFRNIWWSLANEYDFLRTKTEADWDRLGALLQACDPHQRLRSIHNGRMIYDHRQPWVTHVSMQNGAAVEEPGRAEMYRGAWRKPVVYDEVKYEGSGPFRWGELSGGEMVHRYWCGTVAGTYVGHGDYFFTVREDAWTSFGGKMTGQSAPRIAFLRKILEESPPQGIDPIDQWQDPRIGGLPGHFYLVYFGREAPTAWTFELYRNALTDGMEFTVEVIDTWAMTITPVPGVFVTAKKDRYMFVDREGRAVPLPGKPYHALRIRHSGGAAPLPMVKAPIEP